MNPNEREYNDWDMPQIEEMLPEGECDDMLAYESQFGEQQPEQDQQPQQPDDMPVMLDEAFPDRFASDEPIDMTDVEADADTLASAGWGTDEDYGHYGCGCYED